MRHRADDETGAFVLCDPAAHDFSPIAGFSQVASKAGPGRAPRSPAPPLEGTAVSTTPSSDIRPEGGLQ